MPYYPWLEEIPFQGFPVSVEGKVVLFSGSYLYKIDDKEDTFFHIVADILKDNPNVTMFFAGGGDSDKLNELISREHLYDRFILLGNRTDIAAVFKHIDIYIGTYPLGGGLMSQYAALSGKPIVAYKTYEVEKVVCNKNKKHFVYDSIEGLKDEVNHLIRDKKYRTEQGNEFKCLTASQADFRERFLLLYSSLPGLNRPLKLDVDYDEHTKKHVSNLNNRKNFRLEREIWTVCRPAISWKMIMNVLLNINVLSRFINGFSRKKTS